MASAGPGSPLRVRLLDGNRDVVASEAFVEGLDAQGDLVVPVLHIPNRGPRRADAHDVRLSAPVDEEAAYGLREIRTAAVM